MTCYTNMIAKFTNSQLKYKTRKYTRTVKNSGDVHVNL